LLISKFVSVIMSENLNPIRSRILVSDDDHLLTAVAAMALQSNGYEVDVAGDGAIALSLLEKNNYDLVVLDLEMPNVSGFRVIEEMRRQSLLQHIPIIVVTSRADPVAIKKSYDLGATSFVVKPIKWNIMVHHIRYAIRTSRMAAELRMAKCEAEQASQLKGNLLSMISHEFRTPIHAINGFSRLIEQQVVDTPESDDLRGNLNEITQATSRLNSILGDILMVSSDLNGTDNLREDDYSISDLLMETIKIADAKNTDRNIKIVPLDIRDDIELLCDRGMFLRASGNIIDNAIKFSPTGSTISVAVTLSDKHELIFSIADQGPGMSDDQIDNAFQLFSQSDMSSTRTANGLGMGLTISNMICNAHGGRIEIKSVPGVGTAVSLIFPFHRVTQSTGEQLYATA